MWLRDAAVYQIYVRSFQDSNGDGVGDLRGVLRRLDHIAGLGADAVWLSPIYPSPNADYGYDVSDFTAVDPQFGTLADFDRVVAAAHQLGLRVLLDFVPCHTSIEHPWFRQHPEYYSWADAPPNNWIATFGGSAWQQDPATGRYYLHSFFPEQADLNWRNPDVRSVMGEALQFWLERGVDGFRLDALDRLLKDSQLRDDPQAVGPPPLPLHPEHATLSHVHSINAPDVGSALRAIRAAVGDAALIGEVYLPASELGPYLEVLDAVFAFEPMQAGGDAEGLRRGIERALAAGRPGWVLSNHDFSRLGSRAGPENARAMTLLLLSLPGPAFIYQGDEIGMLDAPAGAPPLDRHGRDAFRRPLRWDSTPEGGFTAGDPWLPVGLAPGGDVAAQAADPDSHLALMRRMITLRRGLGPTVRMLDSPPGTLALERGRYIVAVNLSDTPQPASNAGEVIVEARPGDGSDPAAVPAHGGWVASTIC